MGRPMKYKVGSKIKINCSTHYTHGMIGVVILNDDKDNDYKVRLENGVVISVFNDGYLLPAYEWEEL